MILKIEIKLCSLVILRVNYWLLLTFTLYKVKWNSFPIIWVSRKELYVTVFIPSYRARPFRIRIPDSDTIVILVRWIQDFCISIKLASWMQMFGASSEFVYKLWSISEFLPTNNYLQRDIPSALFFENILNRPNSEFQNLRFS